MIHCQYTQPANHKVQTYCRLCNTMDIELRNTEIRGALKVKVKVCIGSFYEKRSISIQRSFTKCTSFYQILPLEKWSIFKIVFLANTLPFLDFTTFGAIFSKENGSSVLLIWFEWNIVLVLSMLLLCLEWFPELEPLPLAPPLVWCEYIDAFFVGIRSTLTCEVEQSF